MVTGSGISQTYDHSAKVIPEHYAIRMAMVVRLEHSITLMPTE